MKKQKIIITGGLGYIGSELCKIYSGVSRFHNITVLDNRFISDRVSQLRNWGINFIQCDILDKENLSKIIHDADVIIHLAGVTDVAYTKFGENDENNKKINEAGIDGTLNILNLSPKDCKIIFPSTHVVFEGCCETKTGIKEDFAPCAELTYSKAKVQSEIDIAASGKPYVILRLGSVYGYSGDAMRIGIMPNLFSKIASQGGKIKLFSGGIQLKSLVSIIDVARCFKFMADSDIKNEIFHVSKEEVTVKGVAMLCKKFAPSLVLEETDDEIPNLGYTISNEKLLKTGFSFIFNLEESIKEMIEKWSKQPINEELEYLQNGQKEFIDARGKISNYELSEPINLIGLIHSKTGSVRANHFHPIQEQKCLLVSGSYMSVTKDLLIENSPVETRLVKAGDLAVIKPNVAHAMVFLEDSTFLNLVRGEREHENYGITHTVPYILVDEELRKQILS
jgi:nucleoside-diphosphate-sugar epimerase